MKFKIDENLPREVALVFQQYGFDAESVFDENLTGSTDASLFETCNHESRNLVTLDLDFSNRLHYPLNQNIGIIIIRIKNQSKATILKISHKIIELLKLHLLKGHVWIVDELHIRIR